MSNAAATAPEVGEYAEYYGNYIKLVPAGDILDVMREQGFTYYPIGRTPIEAV